MLELAKYMKAKFSEYYSLSAEEFDELWNNAFFVFDTNVLLDLYRFSKPTSDILLKIIEKIKTKNQLWLPYQIGLEFHKDRRDVIETELNEYKRLSAYFSNKFSADAKKSFTDICNSHPLISIERYMKQIEDMGKKISKSIKRLEKKHPDYKNNDTILGKITELYEDCIGDEITNEDLALIYKEGSDRYSRKRPPGYSDIKKPEPDRYGDLVIWNQMIIKAKEGAKPIIFITRDTKEDWWYFYNGEKGGPRKELIKEMRDKADSLFHIYEITNFISLASSKFDVTVTRKSSDEIKELGSPEIERAYSRVAEGSSNFVVGNISNSSAGTVDSGVVDSIVDDSKKSSGGTSTK